MPDMPTALVTGGAGFIGGNFARRLARTGFRVVVIDALTYAGDANSIRGVENLTLVEGRIGDGDLVRDVLRDCKPAFCVNFAAETHVDRSIDAPLVFLQTNILETFQLMDKMRSWSVENPSFRILHVSTDEVYGSMEGEPADEATLLNPSSPYSASKAGSDHIVLSLHRTYDLPVLIARCTNNYGPYQLPEKLIPNLILRGINGMPLQLYGDGLNERDWLFVDDCVDALIAIMKAGRPGGIYNVGNGNTVSNLWIARELCRILDRTRPQGTPHESLITFVADRPGHDRRYSVSFDLTSSDTGWRPETAVGEGLQRTVEWYLGNEEWWSEKWASRDIQRRHGLGRS